MFSNMMIKSNGDVIPAHGRCFNLPVGNLYEQNLQEIWNSGSYGKFRRDLVEAGGLFPAFKVLINQLQDIQLRLQLFDTLFSLTELPLKRLHGA